MKRASMPRRVMCCAGERGREAANGIDTALRQAVAQMAASDMTDFSGRNAFDAGEAR